MVIDFGLLFTVAKPHISHCSYIFWVLISSIATDSIEKLHHGHWTELNYFYVVDMEWIVYTCSEAIYLTAELTAG